MPAFRRLVHLGGGAVRLRGVVPAGRREFRERLFRRHTWHRRGRAVDSARSFAKTPSAESTSTPETLPASQPQHGPCPSRRVRRESKESTCRGRNQRADRLPVRSGCRYIDRLLVVHPGRYRLSRGRLVLRRRQTPYGYHYLGEIFVFIFFGLVATCGTMFALAGTISTEGMLGGANVGLIAVAVLCVNNLRDVETDRTHGKHTWMTALGRRNGTVFCDCAAVRRRAVARRLYTAAVDACDADNRNTGGHVRDVRCRRRRDRKKKIRRGAAAVRVLLTGARRNVRVLRGVCLALQRQCNEMKIVAKRGASIVGNGLFWVCQAVDLQA